MEQALQEPGLAARRALVQFATVESAELLALAQYDAEDGGDGKRWWKGSIVLLTYFPVGWDVSPSELDQDTESASVEVVTAALRGIQQLHVAGDRFWCATKALMRRFGFAHASMSLELCPATWVQEYRVRHHVHVDYEAETAVTIKHQKDVAIRGRSSP